MGRLALHSLLSASKAAGPQRTQVYLFIDEFQRLVAGNLELFLQTARSMNIGVILANQTMMDLKSAGVDLVPTVGANTRFKQVFAASDLAEQQELTQTSGETIVHNQSWTKYLGIGIVAGGIKAVAATETVTPRLRPNDILLATDHPMQSIVHLRRGEGTAQYGGLPFVMTSAHHINKDEYEKRRIASWPSLTEETLVADHETSNIDTTQSSSVLPPPVPRATQPRLFPDPVLEPPAPQTAAVPAESNPPQKIDDPFGDLWLRQQARRQRQQSPDPPQDDSQPEEQP